MAGINLSELDASDMCDILHYLFEEDNIYVSEEHMKSKVKLRESVYEGMYGQTYKYKGNTSTSYPASGPRNPTQDFDFGPEDDLADVKPFNPREQPTKPLIKATPFDPDAAKPFGRILDAPLK
jgi:hypothetical protein